MLVFKEQNIDLGDQVNRQIPFLFEGQSKFPTKVFIETSSSCGCTNPRTKFFLEPDEEFKLDGTLSKRPNKKQYIQTVHVKAYDKVGTGRKQLGYYKLTFKVNVI